MAAVYDRRYSPTATAGATGQRSYSDMVKKVAGANTGGYLGRVNNISQPAQTQAAPVQTQQVQKAPSPQYMTIDDPETGNTYGYDTDNAIGAVEMPYMSMAGYESQAAKQVDPTYNSLRLKAEQDASANREQLSQVMAARHGMSGLRGGRIGSTMTKASQSEGAAINEIEGKRQQATAELAQALRNQDWQQAYQLMQLEQQRQQADRGFDLQEKSAESDNAYRQSVLAQQKDSNDWGRVMDVMNYQRQLDRDYMSDEQFEKTYGLSKTELDYQMEVGNREWDWKTDPTNWENDLAIRAGNASIANTYSTMAKRAAGGGSGGGGSSGGSDSSGGLSYNTALIRATDLAKADPRLANEFNYPDGTNYFSLNQLVDAYMTQIAKDTR